MELQREPKEVKKMEERKYTKEDIVEFLRWNSNAPLKVIKQTSLSDLEKFMTINKAWDRFYANLKGYQDINAMQKRIRAAERAIGIK